MADSKRKQLLDYVVSTILAAITTGSGYNVTPATIERGIRNPETLDDGKFPALFVAGADETRENSTRTHFQSRMFVKIVGFVKDANGVPGAIQTQLDNLIEDVTKAFYQAPTQNNLAMWTEVQSVATDDGDLGAVAGFAMVVELRYSATNTAP